MRSIIEDAAQRIARPDRWCQGALARDKDGAEVSPRRRAAKQWDILGAVFKAARVEPEAEDGPHCGDVCAHIDLAAQRLYKCPAETVNDVIGHHAVMDVLRLAWRTAGPRMGRR